MKTGSRAPVALLTGVMLIGLLFAVPASGAAFGTLTTVACSGQGVTVTAALIDWLPAGGPGGCIQTATPTNIQYTGGGPLTTGTAGTILDVPLNAGIVPDFMTFSGQPLLHFDLYSLGPGVANTNCPDTFNAADPVCSIIAGSQFVVRPGAAGATVTLSAFGRVRDGSPDLSHWQGTFSVDFAGETTFDIQQRFLSTGTLTSGHSGSFVAIVPEPGTLAFLGAGFIALGLLRRHIRSYQFSGLVSELGRGVPADSLYLFTVESSREEASRRAAGLWNDR